MSSARGKITCSKCQAENFASSAVCWQCGQPVKQGQPETSPAGPAPSTAAPPPVAPPPVAPPYESTPTNDWAVGRATATSPQTSQSPDSGEGGILTRKVGGKLLLLSIMMGIYSIPLLIGIILGIILMVAGGGAGVVLGFIIVGVYGSILYSGFSLWWQGDGHARRRFVKILSYSLLFSAYRLFILHTSDPPADAITTYHITMAVQWMTLIFSGALLWYLSTGEVKEYCHDWV